MAGPLASNKIRERNMHTEMSDNGDSSNQEQESSNKKGIRHAEKRRTSTCRFADRIARLSIDHYRSLVPGDQQLPQTCLAAILAHDREDGTLKVLSFGVGTKFLSESVLKQEAQSSTYGTRIRDCHAEVLARRGFCRFLCLEMLHLLRTGEVGQLLERTEDNKFKLQPSMTIHMYTSSAPCGNAVLKKFSKMTRERFRDLGPNDWPTEEHEPIHGHSIKMGQFMLLVKKDNSVQSAPGSTADALNIDDGKKVWPANRSDDWTPPGTTIMAMNKGSIHTCSDKICRWNFLGLQGSLLASLIEIPLYLSTLTVGRKMTECICRRAVCCRMGNYSPSTSTNSEDDCTSNAGYRVNHPAVLGTAVYMDESGAVETNSETIGQDVRFHSSLSWAWWRVPPDADQPSNNQLECIDGYTGSLATADTGEDIATSKLSTRLLTELFMEASALVRNTNDITPYSTLSSLCNLKQEVSSRHESIKDSLLRKHRVLRLWNRRSNSAIATS